MSDEGSITISELSPDATEEERNEKINEIIRRVNASGIVAGIGIRTTATSNGVRLDLAPLTGTLTCTPGGGTIDIVAEE